MGLFLFQLTTSCAVTEKGAIGDIQPSVVDASKFSSSIYPGPLDVCCVVFAELQRT